MRLLRAFALLFIFCVDVQVKAEIGGAVLADRVKTLNGGDWQLTMDQGSLLQKRPEEVLELISGSFYADFSAPVKLQTPYTKVWCESECKALFSRKLDQINIKSLSGTWHMQRKGDKTEYQILAGTQVQVGEVNQEGAANMELPQSLPWMPTVREWAHLYPGKFAEFKEELKNFQKVWASAVEQNSVAQVDQVKRSLASEVQAAAAQKAKRDAAAREDAALRAMFREKNP